MPGCTEKARRRNQIAGAPFSEQGPKGGIAAKPAAVCCVAYKRYMYVLCELYTLYTIRYKLCTIYIIHTSTQYATYIYTLHTLHKNYI